MVTSVIFLSVVRARFFVVAALSNPSVSSTVPSDGVLSITFALAATASIVTSDVVAVSDALTVPVSASSVLAALVNVPAPNSTVPVMNLKKSVAAPVVSSMLCACEPAVATVLSSSLPAVATTDAPVAPVSVAAPLPVEDSASATLSGVPILPSVISTVPLLPLLPAVRMIFLRLPEAASVTSFAVAVSDAAVAPVNASAPPVVVTVAPVSLDIARACPFKLFSSTPAPNSTLPVVNLKTSFAWGVVNSML